MALMVPERIEREVVVDAPVERVWEIVTDARHVGTWFGDSAEIDLRPGGEMIVRWDEHGVVHARVETVEPPHRFAFRWARPMGAEPGLRNTTLVEFTLGAEGDGTLLRVVESGFPELDGTDEEKARYAEGNTKGWAHELDELRDYAEQLVRSPASS
jgi:uncharacterized protein YndB with AHSA1/START domain